MYCTKAPAHLVYISRVFPPHIQSVQLVNQASYHKPFILTVMSPECFTTEAIIGFKKLSTIHNGLNSHIPSISTKFRTARGLPGAVWSSLVGLMSRTSVALNLGPCFIRSTWLFFCLSLAKAMAPVLNYYISRRDFYRFLKKLLILSIYFESFDSLGWKGTDGCSPIRHLSKNKWSTAPSSRLVSKFIIVHG
jgi:hypothetical protein